MWLYKLTNKLTGKQYIGTSVNPVNCRINRHVYAAKNVEKNGQSGMPITHAIRKYGITAFAVEVIGTASDYDELMHMEAEAIKQHRTRVPNGYNLTAGGRGSRRPCSQETRAKMSAKLKGRKPWNFGIGPTSRITHPHRATGKGGPEKGTTPWNFGKTTGPLPAMHRRNISDSIKRVRAARFWSGNKKSRIQL